MNIAERNAPVEALAPQTNAGALTGDFINMGKAGHVTVAVHITQATTDEVAITLEQATDVSASGAKAIAKEVPIFTNQDCAGGDAFTAQTPAVAFTTSTAIKHKLVLFEVSAEHLDVAGGFSCLRVKCAASHASNIVSALYIPGLRRYSDASLITD